MMAQPKQHYSVEEYLRIERGGATKHEYHHGEIYALAGSSATHNLIQVNLLISLGSQLRRRPCTVYPSDMRLRIPRSPIYVYPDVSIVCGQAEFEDAEMDILLNPTVIIEILSDSTERYDRGKKFQLYRSIPSLQEYILVAQDEVHLDRFVRQPDGNWLLISYEAIGDLVHLDAIDCNLALEDVYDKVALDNPAA
ncbi:MAG: Uma2 family endonuclease [Roseiflexaceae bacterium]